MRRQEAQEMKDVAVSTTGDPGRPEAGKGRIVVNAMMWAGIGVGILVVSAVVFLIKPWQHEAWRQILAILLGAVPIYAMLVITHLTRDRPYTLNGYFFFVGGVSSIMIVLLCLLLWFLCGERVSDLNLRGGTWWGNALATVLLTALTLGVLVLTKGPLERILPRVPDSDSGLGNLFSGLAQSPWKLVLFVGPVLLIGVAQEELTRVFLLSRLWKLSPAIGWRWFGVVLSAVLFGLAHLYQGPAGMVSTGISGLIMAIYYLVFGRIWPMVFAHYLHDALQFVFIVLMAMR
jgi:membrane protease YdiL (CAAX protease family)